MTQTLAEVRRGHRAGCSAGPGRQWLCVLVSCDCCLCQVCRRSWRLWRAMKVETCGRHLAGPCSTRCLLNKCHCVICSTVTLFLQMKSDVYENALFAAFTGNIQKVYTCTYMYMYIYTMYIHVYDWSESKL